jgi:CubicO group peptidase (beta-lactamase class C family)
MPAYRNALYSDAGYSLLGHVLARITGQSYPDSMQKILFGPLGMNSTTAKPPTGPDLNAINRYLVDNTSSWNVDVQVTAPYVPAHLYSIDCSNSYSP